jgi:hypothetical protein
VEHSTFNRMEVGQTAFFDYVKFFGPIDFSFVNIHGNFWVVGTEFLNEIEKADFNNMNVGQNACFIKASFHGPVDFGFAKIVGKFDLSGAQFRSRGGPVSFNGIKVDQSVLFKRTTFAGLLDLSFGTIQVLDVSGITLPPQPDGINLDYLTYRQLTAKKGKDLEDWALLFALVDHSRYNRQNYVQLEEYCKRLGYSDLADAAYIAGKRRENQLRKWFKPEALATLIFIDWMTGYGRKPGRLFLLWLNWILLGMLFFDPKFLEDGSWSSAAFGNHPMALRFLLSLDRFIPGVDLGLAKNWNPHNQVPYKIWIFWYTQKVLGWGLIPLAFAYVTSFVK